MAETFAQIEARRKREAAARAARPNTGASQSVGGVLRSLAPGGQKANLGGLSRSTVNFLGEASGVYDVNRGVKELQKGNIAGGLGRIALGAVGLVPGVGAAVKGVTAASKLAKATKFVTAASKARPVQIVAAKTAPVIRPLAKPVAGANRLLTKANTPLRPGTTTIGKIVSPFTSPAVLAAVGAGVVGGLTAGGQPSYTQRQPGQTPRGMGGQSLGINIPTNNGNAGGTTTGYTSPYAPLVTESRTPGGSGTGTGTGTTTPTYGGDAGAGVITEDFGPMQGFATSADTAGTPFMTGGGTQATGGATPVGVPGGAQVAGADYLANLAANAAQSYARQAGLREALAQGIEGVQGSAADIIGGRSQAILGQGITGQRRQYQTGMAGEVQRQVGEQEASRQAYNAAVSQAYSQQAQAILDAARARSEQAAQIRRIG